LAEKIVSLNSFGCPISSAKDFRDYRKMSPGQDSEKSGHDSSGYWVFGSHFNHACIPNVGRSFIGNFMIVRAAKDLASGEELTLEYVSAHLDEKQRQKTLSNWGFICDCKLCHTDRLTPKQKNQKRAALLKTLVAYFKNSEQWYASGTVTKSHLDKIVILLNDLEATYAFPAFEQPRLKLLEPYLAVIRIYRNLNLPQELIAMAKKALSSLGFEIQTVADRLSVTSCPGLFRSEFTIEIFLHLASAYGYIGNKKFRDDLVGYVRKLSEILRGYPGSYDDETHTEVEPF
jgi:hypothetical protein